MNKNRYKFLTFIILLSIIIILGFYLVPFAVALASESGRDQLVDFIRSKEIFGVFIFVLIQVIQVVVFIIPGEFIEVVAGMIYGPIWGYVLCQIGMIIAIIIIFYSVKFLGYDFIVSLIGEKKFNEYDFLKNNKKVSGLVAVLYLIPGTPKDALTYFIPFTNITLFKFIVISSIARFPSVISSTLAGSSFQRGEYKETILIFIIIGIFSLIGIVVHKLLFKKKK